mgnify:CR=1 FL=1
MAEFIHVLRPSVAYLETCDRLLLDTKDMAEFLGIPAEPAETGRRTPGAGALLLASRAATQPAVPNRRAAARAPPPRAAVLSARHEAAGRIYPGTSLGEPR